MKFFKFLALASLGLLMTSCNFTETMTLNEDGSGRMSVFFDGSDLMSMGGEEFKTEGEADIDSIINFKDFIAERQDSIDALPAEDREKIMRLERFKMHMIVSEEQGKMTFDMFTDFNDVSEANGIMQGFDQLDNLMTPDEVKEDEEWAAAEAEEKEKEQESVDVKYSFSNNVFKRDAFVKDAQKYKVQVDSLENMAMFFGSSKYKLKYTFAKKIKSTNRPEATFSADGKTMFYEVGFMDYLKDPDVMDIEVVLED